MSRKINFNAGPAALPDEVLNQAGQALAEYKDTGVSILELPHRGTDFLEIIEESKQLVREICGIGKEYEVLWMQGGGRLQFSMVPMNFLSGRAAYIDSGHWAHQAFEAAGYVGEALNIASSKDIKYSSLPKLPSSLPENISYLHYTTNNTIYGTQWHEIPPYNVPLVADMSSDIFCCKRDYSQYDLFYAAAQKNLGVAGNTLVVVKKDFMERQARRLAPILCYKNYAAENSLLNTPNVFGVYVSLLMLRWIKSKGIDNIEKENRHKADLLYKAIDSSALFTAYIKERSHRSLMNVCFTAITPEIEKAFLNLCNQNNITGVKGHRSIGGFRVSLYNAVTIDSVNALVGVMDGMK